MSATPYYLQHTYKTSCLPSHNHSTYTFLIRTLIFHIIRVRGFPSLQHLQDTDHFLPIYVLPGRYHILQCPVSLLPLLQPSFFPKSSQLMLWKYVLLNVLLPFLFFIFAILHFSVTDPSNYSPQQLPCSLLFVSLLPYLTVFLLNYFLNVFASAYSFPILVCVCMMSEMMLALSNKNYETYAMIGHYTEASPSSDQLLTCL